MLIGSFFYTCFGGVGSRKNGGGGFIFVFPQCVSPSWLMEARVDSFRALEGCVKGTRCLLCYL
jgi:hypothetical protein